jgi:NAD(P)-dependent dehydrogenase (short-subunit alcohol dehydrogenase family)
MRALEGRHVVVTGAAGGLGSAVASAFTSAGATLHTPTRQEMDATDDVQVAAYYGRIPALWASIHLAGGFAMAPIAETRVDLFRGQLELNAVSCFLACREAIVAMRRGGVGGRIVNVAARAALVPSAGMIAYTTSKAAVVSLTRCLAEEVKGEGILVNAVAPSIIDSPANRQAMPNADHAAWPKPDEIAAAILWLASPRNTITSGAVVPVYGRA